MVNTASNIAKASLTDFDFNGNEWHFKVEVTGVAVGTTNITVGATSKHSQGGSEQSTTTTYTVTVEADLTPDLTGTIADQVLTKDEAYTSATAFPAATGGNTPITYSVDSLPSGITLNSDRKLTGTATAPLAKTELTYTATDRNGTLAMLPFNLTVKPKTGTTSTPTNVGVTGGDQSLTVTWSWTDGTNGACPLNDGASGLSGFELQYKKTAEEWRGAPLDSANDADSGTFELYDETVLNFTIGADAQGRSTGYQAGVALANGEEYQVRVIAYSDAATCLNPYSTGNVIKSATPSDDLAPALTDITDKTYTQGAAVDFTLPAATGGDGHPNYDYILTPAVSGSGLTFTASTHKLTGTPSTPKAKVTYTYTATESSDSDGTAESANKTFTIGIQPQKPANFTATAGNTQVTLAWTAIAGVSGWEVKQDSGSWTAITNSGAATNSHEVTGLTNGTEYTFKVRAFVGDSSAMPSTRVDGVESAPESATPSDDLVPALPTVADQLYVQGVAVDFTLPAATGGDGHPNYDYTLTPDVSGSGLTFTDTTHKLSGTPSTPQAKGTYTYRATETTDPDGTTESAIKTFTIGIQPQKPANFTATAGNTQVTLAWTAIAGVTKWQYKQKPGITGVVADTWRAIDKSGATTARYTVTGLTNGTAYRFQIRAVNATGPGPASDTRTATPRDGLAEILNRVMLSEVARAMADQTVGAIGRRVAQARQATRTLEVGGQSTLADVVTTHGPALADGTINLKGLLSDSAFVLPLQAQPGAGLSHLTLWGNGAYRNLGGEAGTLDWDGDLLSARLGVDARLGQDVLAGLAVAWQQSEMGYTQAATRQGDYETTLTSIHPYLGWTAPDGGLEMWATAGYGWGDLTITDNTQQQSSDLTAQTLGVGGSSRLWATETTRLRLKGEALHTQMDIDGSATLAAQTVKARRVRLALAGSRTQALAGGAQVESNLELGLRHDAGDGRTGTGAEVGGGLRYTDPARRLTLATQARVLLLHGGDYEDWGISGTLHLAPGADGQGLAVRVQPGWGQTASRVSELWAQDAVAGLRPNGTPAQEGRVDVQVGYGVAWAEALVTPYGTMRLTTGRTRAYGLGSRLTLGSGLQFTLEGLRQETAGAPVEHGVRLDLGVAW